MALALLDGTSASVDFTVAPTSGGVQASIKCLLNYISLVYQRATSTKLTFCSGGWEAPIAGMRRGFGHLDGFVSKGSAQSTPLLYFLVDDPLPFLFTADTGCTIAHWLIDTQEAMGVRSMGEFGRGMDFVTSGTPTVVWVIT